MICPSQKIGILLHRGFESEHICDNWYNPKNTSKDQNINGTVGPSFASQLPIGGAKTPVTPITDIFNPIAVPAKRAPMPFSSFPNLDLPIQIIYGSYL